MESKGVFSEYFSQIINAWRKKNDKYKYIFQPIPYNEVEDNENMYQLHVENTITHEMAFTFYKISIDNESCFIEFLGITYKVLHIDNSIKTPIMKLEDNAGNVIIYEHKD